MSDKRPNYPLRIAPELRERLKRLAEKSKRSLNKEIEYALEDYVRREEQRR